MHELLGRQGMAIKISTLRNAAQVAALKPCEWSIDHGYEVVVTR
jgi:hypothetical protein